MERIKYSNKRYIDDVAILEESIINLLDGAILSEARYDPSKPPQSLNDVFRSISELDLNDQKARDKIKLIAYNVGRIPNNKKQEVKKFTKIAQKLYESAKESEEFWTAKSHITKKLQLDGVTVTFDNASISGAIARGTGKALGTAALGAAVGTGKLMRGAYNMARNAFASQPQAPTVPAETMAAV